MTHQWPEHNGSLYDNKDEVAGMWKMNKLQKALEEMKAEEAQKKKKPLSRIRKEKHLNYYSGWQRGKPVEEEKEEKQAWWKMIKTNLSEWRLKIH